MKGTKGRTSGKGLSVLDSRRRNVGRHSRQPNRSNWVLTDGISFGLPIDPEGSRKGAWVGPLQETTFAEVSGDKPEVSGGEHTGLDLPHGIDGTARARPARAFWGPRPGRWRPCWQATA